MAGRPSQKQGKTWQDFENKVKCKPFQSSALKYFIVLTAKFKKKMDAN